MAKASVKIKNADMIRGIIDELPKSLNTKVLRDANRLSGGILARRERALVPVRDGNTKRSIGVENVSTKKSTVDVGPRRRRRYKGRAAHLIEFGTKQRFKKSGASTGRMPATPFIEPAFNQVRSKMEKEREVHLARSLNRNMKRIIRKYS